MNHQALEADLVGIEAADSPARRRAAFALFFASGAAALIYEVSWSRQIGLRLGQTAQAAGVVLAGYFAGMALGYALAARLAGRVRPLLGYGVAELVAAGWAALVPTLLDASGGPMAAGWVDPGSPGLRLVARAAICFLLLLPATAALGATLPFMAEALSPLRRVAAGRVARAYALNTSGALVGVLAASAVLLVTVGVRGSSYLAAAISAACGLAACGLATAGAGRLGPGRKAEPVAAGARAGAGAGEDPRGWVALAALSGFGTLGLQVLYTRMFALTFHNSTYTFGLVVAASLGGLAIGAALFERLRKRWDAARIASVASGLGAAAVAGSVLLFAALTGLRYFAIGPTWATYLLGAAGLVGLVVLPPMAALGVVLPSCWDGLGADSSGGCWDGLGADSSGGGAVVGRLTAANAIAAAAGALVGGFVLLPTAGLWASFALMAGPFAAVAAWGLVRSGRATEGLGVALILVGLLLLAVRVPSRIRTLPPGPHLAIAGRWEGPYGRIEVVDVRPGERILRQDLHYGLGSSDRGRYREYRQGLLPLLLHETPERVLFLGLGTGLTAGSAVLHPEVREVEVVELIPEVVEAARMFADANFGVVDRPGVAVRVDDARHDLIAGGRPYDVIVSDLFVPWESRAGYLYTVDFYRIVRGRLAEGGLFCQWLPLYQLGREEFAMIADGFATVFPHATLWWGGLSPEKGMVALIGADRPISVDEDRVDALLPALREALDDPEVDLGSGAGPGRLWVGDWPAPPPGVPLNTDEHPRVEFRAPIRHRDDRLLTGDRLLALFDEVFRSLPAESVRFRSPGDDPASAAYRRRVWQRQRLMEAGREG